VGISLGLAFASLGFIVTLIDCNSVAVQQISSGRCPFKEYAEELLQKHIGKNLSTTTDTTVAYQQNVVVFVTGTPMDEHLNPRVNDVLCAGSTYLRHLDKGQLIVLRNTIFPGVTKIVDDLLTCFLGSYKLAICPERIVGVHVRRTDYNGFMRQLEEQLQERTRFLLCSDNQLSQTDFRDLDVPTGTGNPVENNYALATGDYIIGLKSTYTAWASFYGDVQKCFIRSSVIRIDLNAFDTQHSV